MNLRADAKHTVFCPGNHMIPVMTLSLDRKYHCYVSNKTRALHPEEADLKRPAPVDWILLSEQRSTRARVHRPHLYGPSRRWLLSTKDNHHTMDMELITGPRTSAVVQTITCDFEIESEQLGLTTVFIYRCARVF